MRVVAAFFVLVGAVACTAQPAMPKTATADSSTTAVVSGVVPANAIVTLLPAEGAPPMPAEPAVVDQISKQFLPSSIIIRPGQPLEFHNSDDLPHNITVTKRVSGTELFNVSTERGQKYVHTFDRLGQYDVRCDIHEGMEATVIVAAGPVTTIAADDGRFALPNIAPGRYKLSVTYAGQTIERPLDVKTPSTTVTMP